MSVEQRDSGPAAGGAPVAEAHGATGIGVLLIGFVVLSYEIAQIRIFGYSLSPTFTYSAIPITLIGFGLAATLLSLSGRLSRIPLPVLLAASCLGLAVSGLLANAVFARASEAMTSREAHLGGLDVLTVGVTALCILPYAFGGLAMAAVLSRRAASSPGLYAMNLLGSGLGCLAAIGLLRPLGADRLVIGVLVLAAAAGACLSGPGRRRWRAACLAVAGGLLLLVGIAPSVLPFRPDASDQFAVISRRYRTNGVAEPRLEYSAWDPVGRIEVHSWPDRVARLPAPVPFKFYSQDGGAGSALFGLGEVPAGADVRLFDDTLYGAAHEVRPGARTLVIGLGGGPDVISAVRHHARQVTAVEINRSAVEAVTGPFAAFAGNPYALPNVNVVAMDGRSYVRQTDARFDLIQLSGTDTITVQSSGSLVWAESYLYTVEAFSDYLGALADDGVLSVVRFGREPFRLGTIACLALRERGIRDADRHIVVLGQAVMRATIVSRRPWSPGEIDLLEGLAERSAASNAGIRFKPYDWGSGNFSAPVRVLYAPGRSGNAPEIERLLASCSAGEEPALRRAPTDDRPFYFSADLVGYFTGGDVYAPAQAHIESYLCFAGVLVGLALVLILAPLFLFRRHGLRGARPGSALAYFFLLGACYMLVEIGLLQKSTLVVEHPSYSVSVVLASLLGASALGSWLSGRLRLSPRGIVGIAVAGIAVFGGVYAAFGTPIFDALLPLAFPYRMAVLGLLIAPLGIAMGMMFPTGLRALGGDAEPVAAWAVGVNGFASVVGSVLSMPFAVVFGFSALFGVAVAAYLLAALAFVALTRPRRAQTHSAPLDGTRSPALLSRPA